MKVYIRTYGCQMNDRDSENIAAEFVERGWEVTEDETKADAVIVNTCSVREQAEIKAIGKLGNVIKWRKSQGANFLPVVGVTGCMAQNLGAKLVKILPDLDFIAGARKTHKVADIAIEYYNKRMAGVRKPELKKGEKRTPATSDALVDVSDDLTSHLYIKKHLEKTGAKQVCALVSIMQGCQMNCSYCIVPKVRGVQRSRPADDIVDEVKTLAERGVKEVTLLGQVVNAFGRENAQKEKTSEFVRLLQKINDVDGVERIRFTSPHPAFFRDDLIEAYGSLEKLCEYVHLPLQSGSDRVLKEMRRPYRAEQFLRIVEKLRARSGRMSISTDVIVGYPGETDEDFEETRRIFRASGFDMAFIFKYSPRAGTLSAERPDDIPEDVKEARNKILLGDLEKQSLAFNNALIGTTQQILVEARAKRGENMFMGRTRTHRKVVFKGDESLVGRLLDVKIKAATVSALDAQLGPDFEAERGAE